MSADEDYGGGFATVGASRRAARLHARQVDYHALHTGKPTGQRKARPTTASEPPTNSTLDDVIGLLNAIVAQNDRLTERNEELGDEIRRLRGALDTSEEKRAKMEERMGKMEKQIAALVEMTRRNLSSQSQINATYANVLRGGPPTPANSSPASSAAVPARANHASVSTTRIMPPVIELDLNNTNVGSVSPGDIRARLQTALESQEATMEVKCCGITRNPNDAAKVRVFLRTEEDEELVRSNLGWLETAFRGARIRGQQWHPVKVDNVNKLAILNDDRTTVRADASEKIGSENDVEVTQVRWLSKPSNRLYGSAVVYLAKKSEADALLARRVIDVGGEAAYTNVFEHRPRPKRCFKCQSYDHLQFRCRAEERCVKCAGTGHREDGCSSSTVKCASCGGPHRADDRGCPKYRQLLEDMLRQRDG
ncbi:Nucleic-acid-binding protein from transposon X-element [Lasiodiplodia theobromae]|uniref:Nucleic-acid-binding protein from transposon X-element n=1 Tax=Lasiodiplodia theobromae TaxID=45133 RepID=A0A5N5CTG0_9PEZI|nr:Nucleic-acid-binding protein from transposon X-element [Lasiodiplodia theobromae]